MPFPDNVMFCCLALDGPHLNHPDPVALADNLEVSAAAPVELDEFWQRQLGLIEAQKFRQSQLVITAQAHIEPLANEGRNQERMERTVRMLHYCLLLQGCAYTDGALMVSG